MRDSATPTAKNQARTVHALSALVVFIAAMTYYFCWSRVEGRVRSEGGRLGTWEFIPRQCVSGDRYRPGFFGVDLMSNDRGGMRLRIKEYSRKRSSLVVWLPGDDDQYIEIDSTRCAGFDGKVSDMEATVNGFRSMKGSLRAECDLPDGGHLSVSATFAACH